MSDIRLRILSVFLLSASVFFMPFGFAAGFLWWMFFTGLPAQKRLTAAAAALIIAVIPAVVLQISGGLGLLYGAKTFVLLLIAFWFGQSCAAGEFQSLFVWLFGQKIGFDIGMSCEILLMQITAIADDAAGFRLALRQKGKRLSLSVLPSFAFGLLALGVRRAELSAKLLARRGYVSGGTFEPVFCTARRDVLQTVCAAVAALLPFLLLF